ncbi:MAG: hypothetical protein GWN36_17675, partial [Gemmatimonadetes bacterium]|nr:hypothetical protein [Gemmatimonadota bacterium]
MGKGHFVLRYGSGENSRYQLHPLFRAFLLERLREELPPQERAALSRRAGELLLRDGQFEEALPLLQETGSWETLAAEIRARAGQ